MVQPVVFQLHVGLPLLHCPQPEAGIFVCSVFGVHLMEGQPEGQLPSCPGAVGTARKQEIHLLPQPWRSCPFLAQEQAPD